MVPDSFVVGDVFFPGSLDELSRVLSSSGVNVTVGPWTLRLTDTLARFEIAYVGNLTPDKPYEIDASGYGFPIETVRSWCELVAQCLSANGIRFEMTHFSSDQEVLCEYKA